MILAGQFAGEEDVQRFHTEAEAAAQLDHPGIVPVFEIGEHAGQHYFSMGFVEGESLAQRFADGPLPSRSAAELVRQVCELPRMGRLSPFQPNLGLSLKMWHRSRAETSERFPLRWHAARKIGRCSRKPVER